DTGDYEKIDAFLGGEEAFDELIREAHARGMKIILDGVFNHTGDDSRYFNRRGTYKTVGAYQSRKSRYAKWYRFRDFPDDYECWWNIEILPRLDHTNERCRRYFTGEEGILAHWTKKGVDGWRLDVADELSDEFLDELRHVVKQNTKGDGLIIGEVWENAADKQAYGNRRRYLSGDQLDSVMNYPFRNAILALLRDGDAETFYHILTEIYASYPRTVSHSLMNLLGTHDTARILTLLGDEGKGECLPNDTLAHLTLTKEERENARTLLKLASVLQFTVIGVPSVYYGDEAGVEGYGDPFCRRPFPWGREDADLLSHYRALGKLRGEHQALASGEFRFLAHDATSFVFERIGKNERILVLANMGEERGFHIPAKCVNALTGEALGATLTLGRAEWAVLLV
ncbi:MAG: glycoside hydrolase family 13 protein, partial [Ruminococcaceae bacterium]|nr:glycoside hydrolase family 13 protein [Oscillospiraceae bacterium]